VSSETLCVISIGYETDTKYAELHALQNARRTDADLTKCHLYTTRRPCVDCTKAVIQAGIRVVVYRGSPKHEDGEGLEKEVKDEAKACFKYVIFTMSLPC
jgi:deoxycytidylate deaminase